MKKKFKDLEALIEVASRYKFREPYKSETETQYRNVLAEFVFDIDRIESEEIRNQVSVNDFTENQKQTMMQRLGN